MAEYDIAMMSCLIVFIVCNLYQLLKG